MADNEYLAGDYSIADIANWCWARTYKWSGIEIDDLEHVKRWLYQIRGRPAVELGIKVPDDPNQVSGDDEESAKRFAKNALNMVIR